ncbi:hypothetical protein NE848_10725 [Gramella jeungdoensis]|uniref:Lipoprotein n=1 Tax=Gramella jeungdoensis TaxID=708091 RepID=A0ABT0Z293_9FLAO|nr:DUF6624 domain-containing protein [Gramella jeungdoensis]MCM8569856.1 hypothetical protein [Gramella jeungdoensis]
MRRITILLLAVISLFSCRERTQPEPEMATKKIDQGLKEKLENILVLDQGVRELLQDDLTEEERKQILDKMDLSEQVLENGVFYLMQQIDSVNLAEVEKIIDEHGYPGIDEVGMPANEAVFYVIQHSGKIDEYLPLIRKAAENGDISKKKLAMMEDRHLMRNGKEQIYGTQIKGLNRNGEWFHFVWPIKDPDSVNALRKRIGLESMEEYVRKFDIEYKVMTLEQLNEFQ